MGRYHPRLSARQAEVLEFAANGYTNHEIALYMGVSEETVKTHMRKVLLLLDARNRTHAVAIGFRMGLLSTDS